MNDYLKTYKIILTTQSPVHVGSGKKIGKKEYIFDFRTNTVHIPDFAKMFGYMRNTRNLEKYQDYLLKDNRDFAWWLKTNNILQKDYKNWIDYSLSAGDAVEDLKSKKEIYTFVKDAYGCPYIPGSSLKGAIRTALLANDIIKNRLKYSNSSSNVMNSNLLNTKRNYLLQKENKEVEQHYFNTINRTDADGKPVPKSNAVNDIMSGIRISDSKPLDISCLVLCSKVDENTAGVEREIPMLRECLKPGTTIEFDMVIDTTLCSFDKDDILAAINNFALCNAQYFDSSFKKNGILAKNTIVIGGGTGYQTKTVIYPLLGKSARSVERISKIIDATLSQKQRNEHKHSKDRRIGISPHTIKRTYYLKKKYNMGVCTIAIK